MLIDEVGRPLDTIMTMLPRIFSSATSKFVLLAIPFFTLYGGIFTVAEVAVASTVYGLFVGFFICKTLKLKDLYEIFVNSTTTTAVVMFITATASLFAYILTRSMLDLAISAHCFYRLHCHSELTRFTSAR